MAMPSRSKRCGEHGANSQLLRSPGFRELGSTPRVVMNVDRLSIEDSSTGHDSAKHDRSRRNWLIHRASTP